MSRQNSNKTVHVQSKTYNSFDVYNNTTGVILGEIVKDGTDNLYTFIPEVKDNLEVELWDSIMFEVDKINSPLE